MTVRAQPFIPVIGNSCWLIGNNYCKENYEKADKQGIHSIQLISEEAYNNHDYTIHSQDDRPGVYVYI